MRSRSAVRKLAPIVGRNPRRVFFALAICGIVTSKAVHLKKNLVYEEETVLPFILFFPTFFLKDVIAILLIAYSLYDFSFSDLLFYNHNNINSSINGNSNGGSIGLPTSNNLNNVISSQKTGGPCWQVSAGLLRFCLVLFKGFFGWILPVLIWIASACELSYYLNTQQLADFAMAARIIVDFSNFKSVLTGTGGNEVTVGALVGMLFIARFERSVTDAIVRRISAHPLLGHKRNAEFEESLLKTEGIKDDEHKFTAKNKRQVRMLSRAFCGVYASLVVMSWFRPERRFDISVNSIPVAMLDAFPEWSSDAMALTNGVSFLGFPYPELVQLDLKSEERKNSDWLFNEYLPDPPPAGFDWLTKKNNQLWTDFARLAVKKGGDKSELRTPKGYHYAYSPLKISNMHKNLLPELVNVPPKTKGLPLKKVKIRNVILLQLESTRYDMFPLYKESNYASYARENSKPGTPGYTDIDTITPFARKLFGEKEGEGGMGGLITHGTESYCALTQKSLIASHCGTSPIALDWFQEANGKCYLPCLANVFKLLNREAKSDGDWRSSEWLSTFLQTATVTFDRQDQQFEGMGYTQKEGSLIVKETLESPTAKFPEAIKNRTYNNWMGYDDDVMFPYFRDRIREGKKQNKRVFLSTITTVSHLPWNLPQGRTEKKYTDLYYRNKYFNAMAYNDEYVAQFFKMLEEEGIANETLVIVAGDHGMSAGDDNRGPDGSWNPIPNPFVGLFRIPLMFHHPELPPVHLHANASNRDILPTVLDFILSSDSLPPKEETKHAKLIKSLIPSYEGQSLIRHGVHKNERGMDRLNIHLVSPGGEILAVSSSDPAHPYRLRVPLNKKRQYGMSNLNEDPQEQAPLRTWTADSLYKGIEKKWGPEARKWAEKTEKIARWAAEENKRRWGMFEASAKRFTEFGKIFGGGA